MLETFRKMGYKDLCAMVPGYEQPKPIHGLKGVQIPDLTCHKNDPGKAQIILDVETCDSILAESKTERWTLLIDFCSKTLAEFHVAVPAMCELSDGRRLSGEELLVSRFKELGIETIDAKIWMVKTNS